MSHITIVVPTINRPTLQRAVSSAADQGMNVLVVGDGVEPTAEKALNITAPKTGKAALTRNQALGGYIRTPWVGFLDDDDVLSPDYYKHFMTRWGGSDIVVFQLDTGEKVLPYRQILRYGNVGINFAMRTELFVEFPFLDVPNGYEDWGMIAQLKSAGKTFEFMPYSDYIINPKERE